MMWLIREFQSMAHIISLLLTEWKRCLRKSNWATTKLQTRKKYTSSFWQGKSRSSVILEICLSLSWEFIYFQQNGKSEQNMPVSLLLTFGGSRSLGDHTSPKESHKHRQDSQFPLARHMSRFLTSSWLPWAAMHSTLTFTFCINSNKGKVQSLLNASKLYWEHRLTSRKISQFKQPRITDLKLSTPKIILLTVLYQKFPSIQTLTSPHVCEISLIHKLHLSRSAKPGGTAVHT